MVQGRDNGGAGKGYLEIRVVAALSDGIVRGSNLQSRLFVVRTQCCSRVHEVYWVSELTVEEDLLVFGDRKAAGPGHTRSTVLIVVFNYGRHVRLARRCCGGGGECMSWTRQIRSALVCRLYSGERSRM